MKTDTRELLDAVTVWALDFDPEIQCEAEPDGQQCENVAAYVVRCKRCRQSVFVCDPCLSEATPTQVPDAYCDGCELQDKSFFRVFDVIPIGGV